VFGRRFPISFVFPRWPEFSPTGKPLPRFCSGRNSEMGWVPYAGRAPLLPRGQLGAVPETCVGADIRPRLKPAAALSPVNGTAPSGQP